MKQLNTVDEFNDMLNNFVRYNDDDNVDKVADDVNKTDQTRLVVVDFYTTWCQPCRHLGPVLERLVEQNTDVEFYKIDLETSEELANYHNIKSIPTLYFYKNGDLKQTTTGFVAEVKLQGILDELKN